MENFNNITLSDWGSWSSVIGLLISIVTLFIAKTIKSRVESVKKEVMFNTRISPLLDDLENYITAIFVLYKNFDSSEDKIKHQLALCKGQLESIILKIPDAQRTDIDSLVKELKLIPKTKFSEKSDTMNRSIFKRKIYTSKTDVWKLYTDLSVVSKKLNNLVKDKSII